MSPNVRTLLLVEDNEDDLFFMKRAIVSAGIPLAVDVAPDGQAAIDYLQDPGHRPVLVFLDLKLPHKSGLEVLEWIRSRPELRTLIVLILTSSREDSDVEKAYSLGVNSFLVKPPSGGQLNTLVKLVKDYWIDNPQVAVPKQNC
jgi:CheY-like chemotaxis protein